MGWLWSSSSDATKPKEDAYQKLDPSLREFLDRESPARNQHTPKTATDTQPRPSYREQLGLTKSEDRNPDAAADAENQKPIVPPESLYQDGRYAHLWKNYVPLAEAEGSLRSDTDQLQQVIEQYNERKAQIGRTAVENCVFEQLAESDCFMNGGWSARMTMCREENRAFNRCYTMQSKFLKALGYMSMQRTAEEEEKIQMHADRLYQEMLAREKSLQQAKEAGLPEPTFKPLLNNATAAAAMGVDAVPKTNTSVSSAVAAATAATPAIPAQTQNRSPLDIYSEEKRKAIEARLAGKTPAERELEIQLLVADSNNSAEYAGKIEEYFKEEQKSRADRRERGRETFGDTIKRMWGWDR